MLLPYLQAQWQRIFGLNVSMINAQLFVGGQFSVEQWPELYRLGIRAVLSLQAEHEDQFMEPYPSRQERLLVADFTAPTLEQLDAGVAFVQAAHAEGLPVFIHCHAGVGRAPIMAAACLMANEGLDAQRALERIRAARPIIGPGRAQVAQLVEWGGKPR
ncbi:protein-tyrosine phosphatase family protein [Candidatus Viridilinea mediisalina]|uniref:Phosphatase n=1 Tax=Candidatus Viridilinea mediisalina TaxID=2024553 RepID=A0A2A6RLR4_9CHLR|nr:dual specificity protein phosphatase [Candidatus Viridilinea mediisalina]PDW03883.1 phosphatase [Candidatus Viridilinea mediisalina]